jgi:GTP:adenosylcobinamide-phosphate guanylyltransferase
MHAEQGYIPQTMETSEKPVVLILAAGLGTRMKSEVAKVLHQVAGRSLIAWAVDNARAAGAGRIVAVLGHQADTVRAQLEARYGAGAVEVALQTEQRGTGHAVQSALAAQASISAATRSGRNSGASPVRMTTIRSSGSPASAASALCTA